MEIKYLGHSAFEFLNNGIKILVDPFLVASPNYDVQGTNHIFVTHGHGDHLGSAIEISKTTGADITAVYELGSYCSSQGANANGIGLGSWLDYDFGRCIFLPAFHSSSVMDRTTFAPIYMGCPAGILFEIDGKRIFHAGDTCLNSEMKVLGDVFKPDVALLPIGGTFTMDIEQAAIASDWIGADIVVPMHYNTFDAINADVNEFEAIVQSKGKLVKVLSAGESFSI